MPLENDVKSLNLRFEFSCSGRTVLQYCCCLIAILTVWKKFRKISHRKGSTRVRSNVTSCVVATISVNYKITGSKKETTSTLIGYSANERALYLTNTTLLTCLCAVIETWMTSFKKKQQMLEKMPSGNTRKSWVFSSIFSGWHGFIRVYITAQRHKNHVLFVL